MNVEPNLKPALEALGYPVAPDCYDGEADEYIVFNYSDERPTTWVDDVDLYDLTTVQVHFFTRYNLSGIKPKLRALLRRLGFTILSTEQYYENDTKYRHVIIEAEIASKIKEEL